MVRRLIRSGALLLVLSMFVAACSADDTASDETTTTEAEAVTTTTESEPTTTEAMATTTTQGATTTTEGKGQPVTDVPELGIGSPSPEICRDRDYTIGFNVFSDTDAVAATVAETMLTLADDLGCVEVISTVDDLDPAQVVTNAELFVQQGVDGVVTFNVIAAAGPPAYEIYDEAGIRYVSIAIEAGPTGRQFVVDDYSAGYQAGEAIALAYQEQFGEGFPYVILGRFDEAESGVVRLDGSEDAIRDVLEGIPDENVLAIDTEADPANSQARTLDTLSLVPDDAVVLLTGINDDTIFAMLQGARQAGYSDDQLIVGTQGTAVPSGVQFVCENEPYVGGVDFNAHLYVEYALPAVLALINGDEDMVPNPLVGPSSFLTTAEIEAAHPDLCG